MRPTHLSPATKKIYLLYVHNYAGVEHACLGYLIKIKSLARCTKFSDSNIESSFGLTLSKNAKIIKI